METRYVHAFESTWIKGFRIKEISIATETGKGHDLTDKTFAKIQGMPRKGLYKEATGKKK
jgi:hypothetical protein